MPYLEPSQESAIALATRGVDGPVVMLNLLRFREWADYSADPALAPDQPISGAEAYRGYADHTLPFLEASGGEVLLEGDAGAYFIGPPDELWDYVLLVRQRSVQNYFDFASNAGYLAAIGHRTAAIEDSRLLPILAG